MARPPRRSFTLLDAIALVAATALGCKWVLSHWYLDTFDTLTTVIPCVPEMCLPVLTAWTLAVAALRLLPPRPVLRRVVLQPGAAACGAIAVVLTMANINGYGWSMPDISVQEHATAVAIAWALLLLGHWCRPESSWIDRLGRVIGLAWILLELWFVWDYAWLQWQTAGG